MQGIQGDLLASEDTVDSTSLLFCSPEALIIDRLRCIRDTGLSYRMKAVVVDEDHSVSKLFVVLICNEIS